MTPIEASSLDRLTKRGIVLRSSGRVEEALECFDRAISLAPDIAQLHVHRGISLFALHHYQEATESFRHAVSLNSKLVAAHINLAAALYKQDRVEEALLHYDEALALSPERPKAHFNRGKALVALGRYDEALASFNRAVAIKSDYAEALHDKGQLLLLRGEFATGWRLYESRRHIKNLPGPRLDHKKPLWLGDRPLEGKTILLHAEQGFGDTIQFCRYAKLVADRGTRVILEVQRSLKSLMETLDGPTLVVRWRDPCPGFDMQTPLMSLPLAFATTLDSVPAKSPYLYAGSVSSAFWKELLGERRLPRVGLAWSGRPTHLHDLKRSIPFVDLLPLLRSEVEFIGLQKEVRPSDEGAVKKAHRMRNFGPSLLDFADTAALIQDLDLVISVDTSVAHLAGALGKPVWIMLPFVPDWRWLLNRDDSPWYPSARLFRQTLPGDWKGVVARVTEALKTWPPYHRLASS